MKMRTTIAPQAWLKASTAYKAAIVPKAGTTVTAAIDMSAEVVGAGLCPACKSQMEGPVFCSGKPMLVCWDDRVTMPYEDQEHTQHSANYTKYEEQAYNPFGS